MPELPEIEHLRRTLERRMLDATIVRVELRRPDVVRTDHGRGGRRAVEAMRALVGATVTSTARHGKQLALVTTRGAIVAHLGMSGRLQVIDDDDPAQPALLAERHVHATVAIVRADGRDATLLHRDPRRFGGLWLRESIEAVRSSLWAGLGPDALDIDQGALVERLRERLRALKPLLLDQSCLAGVGNIYVDESLHQAGLHPSDIARWVPRRRLGRLHAALRDVLHAAVAAGGSTIRDYQDATGRFGTFAARHRVYGRGGEPCLGCGARLRESTVGGRTTVHCHRCQPGRFRRRS